MAVERLILGHSDRRNLTDPRTFWLNVAIYDTAAEMHVAAKRLRPNVPVGPDVAGTFQPNNLQHIPYLGIMRLCREHLTATVIVHECVHAAVSLMWKMAKTDRVHLDPRTCGKMLDHEENLAYAVGGMSVALMKELGVTGG